MYFKNLQIKKTKNPLFTEKIEKKVNSVKHREIECLGEIKKNAIHT